MLIRFTVENFMSFRDKTEFNMLTSPEAKYRRHKNHVTEVNGVELLRGAAIYGANGSGKSNLVKAFNMVRLLLIEDNIPFTRRSFHFKLNDSSKDRPVKFCLECTFEKRFFEFIIELNNSHGILKESLSEIFPNQNKEDFLIYSRTNINQKLRLEVNSELFTNEINEIKFQLIAEDFKNSHLLIFPALVGRGIEQIDFFYKYKASIFPIATSIKETYAKGRFLHLLTEIPAMIPLLNNFISNADIGITRFEVQDHLFQSFFGINESDRQQRVKDNLDSGEVAFENLSSVYNWAIAVKEKNEFMVKSIVFYHKTVEGKEEPFITWYESEGTLTYLCLAAIIVNVLYSDITFIIDEIEKSLHPLLVKELVTKFMGSDSAKGQLIFTSHETHLLDLNIFRQDEIWFTEKDKEGASHIYPLSDFNPRYDLDIEKGYLNGRFGGIPFLGNLDDLNWNKEEAEKA